MNRHMNAGAPAPEPRLVEGPARNEVGTVRLALGPFCDELDGTEAEIGVEEGALVVRALHPEGDPLFKAMPNDGIEAHVRLALRALTAATAADPMADGDGRRIHAEGCILYPTAMEDATRRPGGTDGVLAHRGNLAAFGVAAVIAVLMLVAADAVHPLVLLMVPSVGIGAWALVRAERREVATMASLPGYDQHLRRGRVQAMSISRAASRARGLST